MKERKANYDLLRIIATFAVILIHINANYLDTEKNMSSLNLIIEDIININYDVNFRN